MEKPLLHPLTAADELARDRILGKLLAVLLPAIHEPRSAWAVAQNVWLVWCALGREDRPEGPEQLLERYSLGELAELAGDWQRQFDPGEETECAVNESYDRQVKGGKSHDL